MVSPIILVVDDEPLVRVVAVRFLERNGYQAPEAGSGEEALRILHRRPCDIALLLTDIAMPGISGIQLAEEARKIQPTLPVVFMSAYCSTFPESLDGYRYIQKPFKPQELLSLVAEALTVKTKTAG